MIFDSKQKLGLFDRVGQPRWSLHTAPWGEHFANTMTVQVLLQMRIYFPISLVAVEGMNRTWAVLAGECQGAEALWTGSLDSVLCCGTKLENVYNPGPEVDLALDFAGKTGRQSTISFRGFHFSKNAMKRIIVKYSILCVARIINGYIPGTRQHKGPRNKYL